MKNKRKIIFLPLLLALAGCAGIPSSSSQGNSSTSAAPAIGMPENPTVYFSFEENNANVVSEETGHVEKPSINSHLLQSPTLEGGRPIYRDGVIGKALSMDGYSTYAEVPSSELMMGGSSFSILAYVAPRTYNYTDVNDSGDSTVQGIVSQYYNDGSFSMGFTLGYKRGGKLYFGVGAGDHWYSVYDGTKRLNQYEWNSVCAVFDGNNGVMRLFLNGSLINSLSIPAGTQVEYCDLPFCIGRNSVTSSEADCLKGLTSGLLDEVIVYNRALDAGEYQDYYRSTLVNGAIKEIPIEDVWLQNSLVNDAYRPQFHGGPYEHWMNEPHAPIYYNGTYHLFYQSNPNGPYFNGAAGINWGHLTSPDMVTWTPRPEILQPTEGSVAPDGLWSGASTYDKDGNPVIFFTAGDYAHTGMVSNQNVGIAYPKDLNDPLLLEWEMDSRLAIVQQGGQGRGGEFRDPAIYKEGDDYYLTICSGDESSGRGTCLIYHTNANKADYFHNWEYKGHVFDYGSNDARFGSSWELPVLLPLQDQNGNQTEKFIFAMSPAPASTADNNIIYWIGRFDRNSCRFLPDHPDPRRLDYGPNVFTGPNGFIDPLSGDVVMTTISQSLRESRDLSISGWAHNVGMARRLYFDTARNDLGNAFVSGVANLAVETVYEEYGKSTAEASFDLSSFRSDMYRIEMETNGDVEVRARMSEDGSEYTIVNLQNGNGQVSTELNQNNVPGSRGTFNAPLSQAGSHKLDLLVDHSEIEAIFGNERSISARSYPIDYDASRLSFAGSGTITNIKITTLKSIYE